MEGVGGGEVGGIAGVEGGGGDGKGVGWGLLGRVHNSGGIRLGQ